jgi:hypothetical protein
MNIRLLVCYTHFVFNSKTCYHGSGGAAVDFTPIWKDPYVSPCKYFKLIARFVPENH